MKISPFSPIFFIDRKADGIDSPYRQVFSTTDIITLEILCTPEEVPLLWLTDEETGARYSRSEFKVWHMNSTTDIYLIQFALPEGVYSVEITDYGKSEIFEVTANEEILRDTTLIQYTMKDNRRRTDCAFVLEDGERIAFDFRVHGGFKDSGWQFSVDSEQFADDYSNVVQLYGLESTQKRFTLGGSEGVPVWFGELLNRLLVCTYVYFDGEQYVRKESNVPEATQTIEGVNSFTFLQTLQKAVGFDVKTDTEVRLLIRREDGTDKYRITENEFQRVVDY